MIMRRCQFCALIGLTILILVGARPTLADILPNRLKLWEIVHDQCVVGQNTRHDPSPCIMLDLSAGEQAGYAILPDRHGVAQFLLIPTRRITGLEDPAILADDLPAYWAAAWEARRYVLAKLKVDLPQSSIGLAINSQPSRSQDQLHIHIDCMQPEVVTTLSQHVDEIHDDWTQLSVPLLGQFYRTRRVAENDLVRDRPFKQLAKLGRKPEELGLETLIVTSVGNELIMLTSHVDAASDNAAHGEDLLDADCKIVANFR